MRSILEGDIRESSNGDALDIRINDSYIKITQLYPDKEDTVAITDCKIKAIQVINKINENKGIFLVRIFTEESNKKAMSLSSFLENEIGLKLY